MADFYIKVKPVIDFSVRGLCLAKYHNHPKGCPNYNKRSDCPPLCPTFDKVIDLNKVVHAIYNKYDLGNSNS